MGFESSKIALDAISLIDLKCSLSFEKIPKRPHRDRCRGVCHGGLGKQAFKQYDNISSNAKTRQLVDVIGVDEKRFCVLVRGFVVRNKSMRFDIEAASVEHALSG